MKKRLIWIISVFLIWEILILSLAFIAPFFIKNFGGRFPYLSELKNLSYPDWFWVWGNFDGVHYLRLAEHGYSYAEYSQAFFPLYPTLIIFFKTILFRGYFVSGFAISVSSFLVSLFLLYQLISIDYKERVAKWVIIFLLLFPTSFYFTSIYTESIFFLLVISSFLSARKNYWALAGIFGFLASLTRFIGIFLFPALILEYYLQNRQKISVLYIKKALLSIWWLLLIPAGLGVYMVYLAVFFNNPFYFVTAQPSFGAFRTSSEFITLPQVIWRYFRIFFTVNIQSLAFFNAAFEFVITISFLVIILISFFRTRISWALFSLLSLITPTLTGTFLSMPRFVLTAFPVFIIFAQIKNFVVRYLLLFVFFLLLIVCVFLFTRGYWVA